MFQVYIKTSKILQVFGLWYFLELNELFEGFQDQSLGKFLKEASEYLLFSLDSKGIQDSLLDTVYEARIRQRNLFLEELLKEFIEKKKSIIPIRNHWNIYTRKLLRWMSGVSVRRFPEEMFRKGLPVIWENF